MLEPLRHYQTAFFERAGAAWEQKQRQKAVAALTAGHCTFQSRNYRVAEAASGHDDRELLHRLRLLFTEAELWAIVPPQGLTVDRRALAFRCLSRLGCAAHQLLGIRHSTFPTKIFLLLKESGLADEFKRIPACVLGEWAANLRADYPDLSGVEFFIVLAEVASSLAMDTSVVESKHATVRRLLKSASLQTHTQTADALSARWLLLQYRQLFGGPAFEKAGGATSRKMKNISQGAAAQRQSKRKRKSKGAPTT